MTDKEFINKWTSTLSENGLKNFPADFLENEKVEEITLPGKTLVIGEEFFGDFEVLTADGNAIMQVSSQNKAKYLVYASRFKLTSVKIPTDEMQLKSVITKYESCLDAIIKEIEADYKKIFPGEKRSNNFVNEIFRILNLNRY